MACAAVTRTIGATSVNPAAATRDASGRFRLPSRINASRRSSMSSDFKTPALALEFALHRCQLFIILSED